MKDWKRQFIEMASLTPVFDGDMPEFEYERKLIVFIETLLQEEREKVVVEIIDFYKDWTIGGTDENGEYNSKAGIILSPEVLKALTLKYLSKKGEKK